MATKRTDFLLNSDGDFPLQDTVVNGKYLDTPFGYSDQQHVNDLIVYNKGWLKHAPDIGFGVGRYLNSEYRLQSVSKELKIELNKDGYNCNTGVVSPATGGGFFIDSKFIFPIY